MNRKTVQVGVFLDSIYTSVASCLGHLNYYTCFGQVTTTTQDIFCNVVLTSCLLISRALYNPIFWIVTNNYFFIQV